MKDELRATIEEIARAKGISYAEALRQAMTILEKMVVPPPAPNPPTTTAPALHQPIDDSGDGCVAWCPACRDDRRAIEGAA